MGAVTKGILPKPDVLKAWPGSEPVLGAAFKLSE